VVRKTLLTKRWGHTGAKSLARASSGLRRGRRSEKADDAFAIDDDGEQ
jgi:hypothetical protein